MVRVVARDFYPIKVSDSGEYEYFIKQSNGHLFITVSQKLNITVAGKLMFPLRINKL